MDVEEQRARGVGVVRGVHAAGGQLPDEPAVDRTEAQLAVFGTGLRSLHVVEQPADFARREVGVDHQTGLVAKGLDQAPALELGAQRRRAAVLPDDGAGNRLSGSSAPHHRSLALVGDADGGQCSRRDPPAAQRLAHDVERDPPDLLGIMLDPAGLRIMLTKFRVGARDDPTGTIVYQDRAARGSLIDGKHVARPQAHPPM